jgi:phage tail-like protein
MAGGGIEEDAIPASHFYIEISATNETIFFQNVSGGGSTTEVVQYKGTRKGDFHTIQMTPGKLTWNEIVCKRGLTSSMDPWKWRKQVEDGQVAAARQNISIVAVGQDGSEVARWNVIRAWPSSISMPQFDANTGNTAAVEELKIAHEGMTRDH